MVHLRGSVQLIEATAREQLRPKAQSWRIRTLLAFATTMVLLAASYSVARSCLCAFALSRRNSPAKRKCGIKMLFSHYGDSTCHKNTLSPRGENQTARRRSHAPKANQ
ncbi:uncharacterized protein ARMOST_10440 [Armillaria ostoyae]|uniref:Uncharacterized protein n=1 Tax=Armillaria ostoyae TaxID=47428 RepID=A0A284REB5_ARMOS|nr:uncharacterized protein ARMOST_10440 [Armillaria ostoyae]